jgi:hypothetical protein
LSKGVAAQPPSELVEDIMHRALRQAQRNATPFDKLRVTKLRFRRPRVPATHPLLRASVALPRQLQTTQSQPVNLALGAAVAVALTTGVGVGFAVTLGLGRGGEEPETLRRGLD